jgi:diguanylate cyclase (GGDEF)-like protein/PAS domain S-box-containing protein
VAQPSTALLIGAAVFGAFGIYVWRRRGSSGAKALILILVAGVEYTVTYALELSGTSPESQRMWGDLKYLGICLLPAAWLAFALQYTRRDRWLTRRFLAVIAVEPVLVLITLALPVTHDLVRSYPAHPEQFPIVRLGPIGWLNVAYSYAILAVSTGLFVVTLARIARPYRRQARVVIGSLLIPLVLNVLYNFNVGPFGRVDLTAFGFVLTALVLVWGILRLRLLDIMPIARNVIVETLEDAVVVLDAFQRVAELNPAAERVLGSTVSDAIGRPIEQVLPELLVVLDDALPVRTIDLEVRIGAERGGRDYEVTVSPLPDDQGRSSGRLIVLRDISERKLAEERLERMAHYDTLTGLPNRKLFGDRLSQAIIRARRSGGLVGLLFLDVDNFKDVNDTLGHDVGDLVLKQLAARVQSCVRAEDTVARLSGDEFTVILPDANAPEDAAVAASRILDALRRPVVVEDRELYVTASIGVCLWPTDGDDPRSLLRNADVAMYRAKARKNRFEFYATDLSVRAARRLELDQELRRALEREELRVHYQPIVSLEGNRVVAFEALVRWQHPERGLIGPSEFLWRAEETDLIERVGRWVLEQACGQAMGWRGEHDGQGPAVSVNLAARQLRQSSLATEVDDVLRRTGLHPGRLILEISETVVMDDVMATTGALLEVRGLGVRLALDDFGTGTTSLSQLRRFPLDTLKIDRVFVDGLGLDPEDGVIVGATLGLAHALGLSVIAEGVETPGQVRALQRLGCDLAQGFHFARPLPAERVPSFIAATSPAVGSGEQPTMMSASSPRPTR